MVKRTQQDVNYMLEGPFHLLVVKQQAFDAYQAYIEAVRDYWLARAELGRAVGARLPDAVASLNDTAPMMTPDTATHPGHSSPALDPLPTDHTQHPGGAQ